MGTQELLSARLVGLKGLGWLELLGLGWLELLGLGWLELLSARLGETELKYLLYFAE